MKTVHVDDSNQAAIVCPKCGHKKNVDVSMYKATHKRVKAKCRCGEEFRLTLEFRKHERKKVRLPGEYFVRGKTEKGDIIVEDISLGGIRFESLNPHYISREDKVELKFALDNQTKTKIRTPIIIKWIIDRNVGGQFFDPKSLEKDLGTYLQA
jgi:hypothetical protein